MRFAGQTQRPASNSLAAKRTLRELGVARNEPSVPFRCCTKQTQSYDLLIRYLEIKLIGYRHYLHFPNSARSHTRPSLLRSMRRTRGSHDSRKHILRINSHDHRQLRIRFPPTEKVGPRFVFVGVDPEWARGWDQILERNDRGVSPRDIVKGSLSLIKGQQTTHVFQDPVARVFELIQERQCLLQRDCPSRLEPFRVVLCFPDPR